MRHQEKTQMRLAMSVPLLALFACGSPQTPGARPHDMSVTGHEQAASSAELNASVHEGQYDPQQNRTLTRCSAGQVRVGVDGGCWTSVVNPTSA
jgi:hypothetical protein